MSKVQPRGWIFTRRLIGFYIALAVVYMLAHTRANPWYDNESEVRKNVQGMATLSPSGILRVIDQEGLLWYVPKLRLEQSLKAASATNEKIEKDMNTAQEMVRAWYSAGFIDPLALQSDFSQKSTIDLLYSGYYERARDTIDAAAHSLSPESRSKLSSELNAIDIKLQELAQNKELQTTLLSALREPPPLTKIFWSTPGGALCEVIFWSWMGILTSLLWNVSIYVKNNNYHAQEEIIVLTKLVYTPLQSVVLVLAIWIGWITLGGYAESIWQMPLLGFVFGLAGRRVTAVLERLMDRILGRAEQSVDEGPEVAQQQLRKRSLELLDWTKPSSLNELSTAAKHIGEKIMIENLKDAA